MEVDMQSPPSTFRTVTFAIKRPRSPGSPSQERQTKRLSLAPVCFEARRTSTATSDGADGRLAHQDDWVRQARELSITSPSSVTTGFPHAASGSGATPIQSRTDEYMAVDDDGAHSTLRAHVHPGSVRSWTMRGHLPLIHITTTTTTTTTGSLSVPNGVHASSPAPFSVLTEPPSSSTESESSTSSVGARAGLSCPPDIFLFPATPSDTPSHQHQFAAEYGHQHPHPQTTTAPPPGASGRGPHARMQDHGPSQSSTQDRIEGSARPSRTTLDAPTTSGRKHRVTMGPRADCVKCRTGVKGHWMHFD